MRHAINDESHFTFENVNDLLLRVGVRRHATPGRQRRDHLIHRLAVRDRPPRDAGTNFNYRIFSFHLSESYAGGFAARVFALLLSTSVCAPRSTSSEQMETDDIS